MYFQLLEQFSDDELIDLIEMESLKAKGDFAGVSAMQTTTKAKRTAFKVEADKLLRECFDASDESQDGVLSKEESAKMFAAIVDVQGKFLPILVKEEQRRILSHELGFSKAMFTTYDIANEEAVRKQVEDDAKSEAKRNSEAIDKLVKDALADYKAQKQSRDAAAFKVLDKSGDGQVIKKEFMAAFNPDSEICEAFRGALLSLEKGEPTKGQ